VKIRCFSRMLINRTGIKLLGFKDLDQLAIEDNVKHSMFIYPDETVRGGFLQLSLDADGIDGE
jgi:ATP-dependent DNA helicase 2 subunit 1